MTVSFEEVRCKGLFSSRESAIINKDKTLIITVRPRMKLRVELFGNDGHPPMFGAADGAESVDYYLFRATAFGGKRDAERILRYFGVSKSDISSAMADDSFSFEYDDFFIEFHRAEKQREIRIKFKETI